MSQLGCRTTAPARAGAVPTPLLGSQLRAAATLESAPDFLRTSLLGKRTERRCASPSVKEGAGDVGESHLLP